MRYERVDTMLSLAMEMQARRGGISLKEIEQSFNVGRRTAMRMRDAMMRNFPQVEEVETDERVKRWRIPPGTVNQFIGFSADELASLEAAIALMRDANRPERAADLDLVATKVRAMMRPEQARRVDPDLEALLESDGIAMRPGPRPRINAELIADLRDAIKGGNRVLLRYRRRSDGAVKERLVDPYGFLHGHRHYLVGKYHHPENPMVLTYALPRIEGVTVLEEYFERDADFSLKAFAEQSFGVFQEDPVDVVWKFTPDAAQEAAEFVFHPSQVVEPQPDGSLIVRFRAGSELEMAWHLFMWGDAVEVLEPQSLADRMRTFRPSWKVLP